MGALLGLLFGAGLLLIWLAATGDGWRTDRRAGEPRLRGLLQRAGVEGVTPSGVVSLSAASAVGGGLVMLAVSQTVPVAIVFAGLGGYLPTAVLKGRARRRQREFAELWPEAVDNLASAVRAGLSLPEALTQLGTRGPEPLREPFVKFGRDYHASGRFGDSLDLLNSGSLTPSATGSARRCGSRATSAAATWAGCCEPCRVSSATTPVPARSSSRDKRGQSTEPGWPSPRPGWS